MSDFDMLVFMGDENDVFALYSVEDIDVNVERVEIVELPEGFDEDVPF